MVGDEEEEGREQMLSSMISFLLPSKLSFFLGPLLPQHRTAASRKVAIS